MDWGLLFMILPAVLIGLAIPLGLEWGEARGRRKAAWRLDSSARWEAFNKGMKEIPHQFNADRAWLRKHWGLTMPGAEFHFVGEPEPLPKEGSIIK